MVNKHKRANRPEIIEKNVFNTIEWEDNITVIDLSNREITCFEENVKLPPNLLVLNLSHNKFTEVPKIVLNLFNLKTLDLSFNNIELFDDTPNFCQTIENLNLSRNKLVGPPYWVWAEQPEKLNYLNLSDNERLCHSFVEYYFEEILQYTTLVNEIDVHNCKLGKHMKLLSTFKNAKIVILGHCDSDYSYMSVNHVENVPCEGLEDCQDLEVLNLSNTHIYNVQHNIDVYKNLVEINLSANNINSLPNEFCNLANLETCILSYNKILYLPDNIDKLKKLTKLCLDNNDLCMLPESINQMKGLKTVDLYHNHLYESLEDIKHLKEYDFAQNYANEPDSDEYLERKRKLRENCSNRLDGRVPEVVNEESEHEEYQTDSEYCIEEITQQDPQDPNENRCSSPEDWDSDDYWIPCHVPFSIPSHSRAYRQAGGTPNATQWLDFVKRKMAEGNFCPMDQHLAVSITEKVRYEKLHNPQPQYESDGQFDDCSDDDS